MCTSERGFSLLETVIAIGVLGAAIGTLAQLVTLCAYLNTASHHRTIAALAAQQKLEQLRAVQLLDESPEASEYLDGAGGFLCRREEGCGGAVYLRQWSVETSTIAPPAVFVRVRVRQAQSGTAGVQLVTVRPRVRR